MAQNGGFYFDKLLSKCQICQLNSLQNFPLYSTHPVCCVESLNRFQSKLDFHEFLNATYRCNTVMLVSS